LQEFKIRIGSWVESIGNVGLPRGSVGTESWSEKADASDVRCPDLKVASAMRRKIDEAAKQGDTLGGIFVVSAWGLPAGLGSHVHWDRRLDTTVAAGLMSIPAIKGVEFGLGFEAARLPGSQVHDVITYSRGRFGRKTNHAGGLEGGMSTGEPLVVRAAMKPIATLRKPLASVDMKSKKVQAAGYERSDVCAAPAAAVVAEAMLAIVLAQSFQEKFGGDSMAEMKANWKNYLRMLARS
jgi:chorismate synthase